MRRDAGWREAVTGRGGRPPRRQGPATTERLHAGTAGRVRSIRARVSRQRWLPPVPVRARPVYPADRPFLHSHLGRNARRKALLLLSLPPTSPDAFDARPSDVASDSPNVDLRLAALEVLVNSVQAEPYNWSAWLKIAECLDGPEEVRSSRCCLSGPGSLRAASDGADPPLAQPAARSDLALPSVRLSSSLLLLALLARDALGNRGLARHRR